LPALPVEGAEVELGALVNTRVTEELLVYAYEVIVVVLPAAILAALGRLKGAVYLQTPLVTRMFSR
jgi:hypothetical protein